MSEDSKTNKQSNVEKTGGQQAGEKVTSVKQQAGEKVKDPKKVELGKKLAKISKEAKERKARQCKALREKK